jgi:hypothetical protein
MNRLATLLFLGLALKLSASTLVISGGGTYSSTTPTSSYSAANEPFSFSFDINSNPSVSGFTSGQDFIAPISNFGFDLNGSPVTVPSVSIAFFAGSQGGLFQFCFGTGCDPTGLTITSGLSLSGPQLYSGSESSPTILTGDESETALIIFVAGDAYPLANQTVQSTTAAPGVPEPSTQALFVAGWLLLAAVALGRKRNKEKAAAR